MSDNKVRKYAERIKTLEGITEHEWQKIKQIIDEGFEKEKRETEIRLSLNTVEEIINSDLFG